MVPIVDRPIIHYVVDEMVASGIRDIVFVTRHETNIIEHYFDSVPAMEVDAGDQDDRLDAPARTNQSPTSTFLRQMGPYGNGTPAMNGGRVLKGPFVYAFGDDLVSASVPFTKQLLEKHAATGGVVLGVQEVPQKDVPRYGMVETDPTGRVTRIVEKPAPEDVTSNLVSFGRFVLPPEIVPQLERTPPGRGGELWLMDAIEGYRRAGGDVFACPVEGGQWFTTGDPRNYLAAFVHYVLERDDLRDDFLNLIRSL